MPPTKSTPAKPTRTTKVTPEPTTRRLRIKEFRSVFLGWPSNRTAEAGDEVEVTVSDAEALIADGYAEAVETNA